MRLSGYAAGERLIRKSIERGLLKHSVRQLDRDWLVVRIKDDNSDHGPIAVYRSENKRVWLTEGRVDVEYIVQVVAAHYRMGIPHLLSRNRKKCLTWPRAIIYYLSTEWAGWSTNHVGKTLGRDHTTVMNGRDNIIAYMKSNEGFRSEIECLKRILGAV